MEYMKKVNFWCKAQDLYAVFEDGQKHLYVVNDHFRSQPLLESFIKVNSQIRRFLKKDFKYEIHTAKGNEMVYSPLGLDRKNH